MKKSIGIDVGGTNISAGVVSGGNILKHIEVPVPKTKKKFISELFNVIDLLIDNSIKSIGIGFPAPFVKGVAHEVQNIPSLNKTNIKKVVESAYPVKCFVENDANAFALAEQKFGAAKGKKNVVGLTLGTGLGCGIIINGKLFSGNTGAAGEISKIPADHHAVEDFVSARYIKKISKKEPKELYKLALKGNRKAKKDWLQFGNNLGAVLAIVVDVLDPEIVVMGGKISNAYNFFIKKALVQVYLFKS